ncbi:hypothetical protein [Nocardia concava]|uniref:hypothetical protein n=1 Tax=Nocardia concava TaxID=257281 RepID=UPI00031433B7|nr:hypothetical protein [Nocardia concava]
MGIVGTDVCLSSFHVDWSSSDASFIARSDRFPGLVARNEFSSLAAMDDLIELIEQAGRHEHSGGRSAAA